MRQHVFAFLVALAVWMIANTASSLWLNREWARSTSIIEGRCQQHRSLLGWDIVQCTIVPADPANECLHSCLGRVIYQGKCSPQPGSGMACWEQPAIVPIFQVVGPCRWRNGGTSCSCDIDDPENVETRTNNATEGTVCYEEPFA